MMVKVHNKYIRDNNTHTVNQTQNKSNHLRVQRLASLDNHILHESRANGHSWKKNNKTVRILFEYCEIQNQFMRQIISLQQSLKE